jgi:TPR repeat protein
MKILLNAAMLAMLPMGALAQDFDKGLTAYRSGDYETALQEWRPLAEQGNASAQHNLGLIYSRTEGVVQD